MSITVTPGYDFTVHEVPRRETLLEQVNGMTITGIDVTALDAAVVPIMYGDVSQVTNSLQTGDTVGTMWVSGIGDVFVQEQAGAVALSRINYGWETRRFFCEPDNSFPAHIEPGVNMWTQSVHGPGEDTFREQGGTHSSGSVVMAPGEGGSYDDNQDGWQVGTLVDDTCVSGYLRICVRGLAVYTDKDHIQSNTWSKLRDYQNGYRLSRPHTSVPVQHQIKQYWHAADIAAERWFGWTPLPGPGASKVSDAALEDHQWKKEHIMYVFGSEQRSNQPN
jgi:hypothetical protein